MNGGRLTRALDRMMAERVAYEQRARTFKASEDVEGEEGEEGAPASDDGIEVIHTHEHEED